MQWHVDDDVVDGGDDDVDDSGGDGGDGDVDDGDDAIVDGGDDSTAYMSCSNARLAHMTLLNHLS
jgi:hypothetical protein